MNINLPGCEVSVTELDIERWRVEFTMLPKPTQTFIVIGGRSDVLAKLTELYNAKG